MWTGIRSADSQFATLGRWGTASVGRNDVTDVGAEALLDGVLDCPRLAALSGCVPVRRRRALPRV